MTIEEVKSLKANVHATFESPSGKAVMEYMERIGSWYPTVYDSGETNDIIARDANRRLIGTLKSIMALSAEQIIVLTNQE